MLNQFVIVGRLKERNILSESKECWEIETESVNNSSRKKVRLAIALNFRKDYFDELKEGDLLGVRGSFCSEHGNDLLLIAEKITFLKSGEDK